MQSVRIDWRISVITGWVSEFTLNNSSLFGPSSRFIPSHFCSAGIVGLNTTFVLDGILSLSLIRNV